MSCQRTLFFSLMMPPAHPANLSGVKKPLDFTVTCQQHITFATTESGSNSHIQCLIPLQTLMKMVKVLNKPEKIIKDYWHAINIL
jgi:hypothetical protein